MKINKDKKTLEYIASLRDKNDLNISLSELFLTIINNDEITSPKEIEIISKTYNKNPHNVFIDKIIDYWDIDISEEDNEEILSRYFINNFFEADKELFLNNPYYKMININDIKEGSLSLVNDYYKPYEIFAYDDIAVDNEYIENSKLAYFKEKFPFIALNNKNVTWMSITPNEIVTMQDSINKAHGNVLVFGLGLGYYPFMISLKENVKNITIIEKDPNIISLFKKYLLPQFPHKEKIRIIEADAFEYMNNRLEYDFAFVDLWHNAEDGIEIYLKFKRYEKNNPKVTFTYWLEKSFYAFLRRAFISLLIEQLEGYDESHYKKAKNSFDRIINSYYQKTKNLYLSNAEEIEKLLDDKSLLQLIL